MSAWFSSDRLLPRGRGWLRLAAVSLAGAALVIVAYYNRDFEPSREMVLTHLADSESLAETIENAAEGYRPRKVLARALPPITDVPLMTAAGADKILNPAELVLGVVVDGEARAYPVNMLTGPRREIINDRLGGRAIAATW